MEKAQQALNTAIKAVFDLDVLAEVTRPDPEHGDYASNIALKIAKDLNQSPRDVAQQLADNLLAQNHDWLGGAEVAGPGFINLKVSPQILINLLTQIHDQSDEYGRNDSCQDKNIIVEYLDPNPLKEIHIGHAYTGTVGDAIASLFEAAGGKVHRVTYQGDVGLHIAKALYGILKRVDGNIPALDAIAQDDRPRFLGETYAEGSMAYENDESAKQQIVELNKKVYDQSDQQVNAVYETCKAWSLQYFDEVYATFGFTPFEKNYMEGVVAAEGLALVSAHIDDGVFTKSDGAVIFTGEKYGLHTRVFVNSQGLPTYEAKDLGNAMLKWRDYQYDLSIIITAEEQTEYFRVMLKALEQFAPEQAQRTKHIAHGMVKLSSGKMGSRTGNVVRALDLLNAAEEAARNLSNDEKMPHHRTALAAIKYAFLKNRIGGDIVYDVNESLSLEGNSGPYLQYAHARAKSILNKSVMQPKLPADLTDDERTLANKIGEYPEVVQDATNQLMPHIVCTYLYDLAQQFNRFYEKNRIIGDPREAERLELISAYATVLKNGLAILRIAAPDRM